ncbi:MAG TPA: GNAT family N-acetyltransferase [Kofleriaceae bacterium]|nr:GNAT family N-acetyltransferase [Kofleriaceae bacterium]
MVIRPAEPRDYDAYARLFRELAIDDPVPTRDDWTRNLSRDVIVVERDAEVIGYAAFHKLAVAGHLRNIAVAPEARRGGFGRALMEAARDRLRADGAREWHLNVKIDNAPAIRLYESLGMTIEHRSTFVRFHWADVARLPSSPPAMVSAVEPSDDDELERAFELLSGRIARTRTRPGRVILQLRDEHGAPVGVACFDPAFPGAYPFCVAAPTFSGALLAALRPHARPGDAWLGVSAEDDDALADALVAAGAEVRLQLLHYRGAI